MAQTKYLRQTFSLPGGGRKYVYAKTKKELEEKVLLAKLEVGAGVDLTGNPPFGEFATLWYTACKKPNIRKSTQEYYKNVLNNHILPYIGTKPIRSIKPMDIIFIMNQIDGLSKELNQKTLQTLRAIFNSAIDNNLLMKSPVPLTLKPGGHPPERKESLSREQEAILLEATRNTRAYPFILIALHTGMRRGEICGLMWDCVDLDEGVIHVRRNLLFHNSTSELTEYLKTDCSVRDLPITPALDKVLRELKAKSNSVFVLSGQDGRKMTNNSFRALWECVKRRQPGPEKKPVYGSIERCINFPVSPHQLRHTFLTRCFENGLDMKEVQYLAGHRTPDLTMRIYLHYQQKDRMQATFEKVRNMHFA